MRKCRIAASCASYLLWKHPNYVGVKVDGTDQVQSGIQQRADDSYNSATDGVLVSRNLLARTLTGWGSSLLLASSLYVGWWFAGASVDSGIGLGGTVEEEPGNRQTRQQGHAELHSSLRVSGRPGDSRWIPIPGALDEGRQAEQACQDFHVSGRDFERVEDSDARSQRSVCACWAHGHYR